MFDWLWNYFWFWTFGWWIIMVIVFPFAYFWPRIMKWSWRRHPRFTEWVVRHWYA